MAKKKKTSSDRPDRPVKMNEAQRLRFHAREQTLRDYLEAFSVPDPQRNIKPAGVFLKSILDEIGASGEIEEEKLKESWIEIAPPFIAKNTTPHSLKNGVLVLRVIQPSIRFQLEQMKGMLVRELKAKLGDRVLRDVRFQHG